MWKKTGKHCVKLLGYLSTMVWIMWVTSRETHVLIEKGMKTSFLEIVFVDNSVRSVDNNVKNLRKD